MTGDSSLATDKFIHYYEDGLESGKDWATIHHEIATSDEVNNVLQSKVPVFVKQSYDRPSVGTDYEHARYLLEEGYSLEYVAYDFISSNEAKEYQYQSLKANLDDEEGYRNDVYLDSRGRPTVGIGHLVVPEDHLAQGDSVSDEQIDNFFQRDSANALTKARQEAASINVNNSDFIVALANANFQLGDFPKIFTETWSLIANGEYDEAVLKLNNSKWIQQTPNRVKNFQEAILNLKNTRGI